MARLDLIHNSVKTALIKDGWIITADPFRIEYEEVKLYADLAAERPFAAKRGNIQIVVEVKSFAGKSNIHEFEQALGQYNLYRGFLSVIEPERKLFLAVSEEIFNEFFGLTAIKLIVKQQNLLLFAVNIEEETIVKWIE
ncbi:MAG: element excision factor XisH family protein [Pyrinomonadaceae bacterium]